MSEFSKSPEELWKDLYAIGNQLAGPAKEEFSALMKKCKYVLKKREELDEIGRRLAKLPIHSPAYEEVKRKYHELEQDLIKQRPYIESILKQMKDFKYKIHSAAQEELSEDKKREAEETQKRKIGQFIAMLALGISAIYLLSFGSRTSGYFSLSGFNIFYAVFGIGILVLILILFEYF